MKIINFFILLILIFFVLVTADIHAQETKNSEKAEKTEESESVESIESALPKQKEFDRSYPVSFPERVKGASDCHGHGESYRNFVVKAQKAIQDGNFKRAVSYYKKHLRCWNEKDVWIKLAEIYETEQKLYLAGLAYRKAGMTQKYNEILVKIQNSKVNTFERMSRINVTKYNYKSTAMGVSSIIMFSLGSIAAATGISLFIIDELSDKSYSKPAQFSLTLAGLSLLAGGTLLNNGSLNSSIKAKSYLKMSRQYSGDIGTTPQEYYEHSEFEASTRRATAENYKKHALALFGISIPMFAVAIYGFFLTHKNIEEDNEDYDKWDPTGLETGFAHFLQLFSLVPAIATLTGSFILLAKGIRNENAVNKNAFMTLNSISPSIDPVSKTYGIAAGFSF